MGVATTMLPRRVSGRERDTERLVSMLFDSTLPPRFWRRVYADEYGCWLWVGALRATYGRTSVGGRAVYAHRVAYEDLVGPIPEGLTIDHLCRIRICVNPWHLEPVTRRENIRRSPRRSLCKKGHPLDGMRKQGAYRIRECLTCKSDSHRRTRNRARALREGN